MYPNRPFCSATHNSKPTTTNGGGGSSNNGSSSSPSLSTYTEQLKALENLDFTTAAKILFSEPVKKKKFGLDFHLVQLISVCLPSLAVYLLALYSRSEMKRMDAELEQKKQAEFEAQAKEMERKTASNPALLEVKERLDKLEQTVKEIGVEFKKQLHDATKTGEDSTKQKHADQVVPENTQNESIGKNSKEGTFSNVGNTGGLAPVTHVPQKSQKDDKK